MRQRLFIKKCKRLQDGGCMTFCSEWACEQVQNTGTWVTAQVDSPIFFNFVLNLRSNVAIKDPLVFLQSVAMIASP